MFHSLRIRLLLMMVAVLIMALGAVAFFASQVTASEFRQYRANDDLYEIGRLETVLTGYYDSQQGWQPSVQPLLESWGRITGQRFTVTNIQGQVVADSLLEVQGVEFALDDPAIQETGPVISTGSVAIQSGLLWPSNSLVIEGWEVFHPSAEPSDGWTPSEVWQMMAGQMIERRNHRQDSGMMDMGQLRPLIHFSPQGVTSALISQDDPVGLLTVSGIPAEAVQADETLAADAQHLEGLFIDSVNRSLGLTVFSAGAVMLLLTMVLSRRILRPVEALTAAARRISKGDLAQRVEVHSKDEIGELAQAFNTMTDSLAQAEQLRQNMVNDVAHELRTPLANIRGYLEALQDGLLTPDGEVICSLHEEAMLLNRLVDDLQELALAEAGQLKLIRETVELDTLINRTAQALTPQLQSKGLTLELDLPDPLPILSADRERLGQVLRNLVRNAIPHTPPGGTITVSAQAGVDNVTVCVRDTGEGIDPEHLPYVFERFYRADSSRARATGGAGLGLAIVRQLVEAHGGHAWAESTPGQGAAFFFTLPVPG